MNVNPSELIKFAIVIGEILDSQHSTHNNKHTFQTVIQLIPLIAIEWVKYNAMIRFSEAISQSVSQMFKEFYGKLIWSIVL